MKLQTIDVIDMTDNTCLNVKFRLARDDEQSYMQSHGYSYLGCRRYLERECDEISAFGREK